MCSGLHLVAKMEGRRLADYGRRHVISGLGAALRAVGVGFELHSAENVTMTFATRQPASSISPLELHRFIRTKPLRVQEFEDQPFVFSIRD
jgi:hypothetical protein